MKDKSVTMKPGTQDRLDKRRKQLLYRASHRGIKEMDIMLGGFAAGRIAELRETELDALETLMRESDKDLLTWFTGEVMIPAQLRNSMFDAILAYQAESVA